jgi:ankyrin repeat protein
MTATLLVVGSTVSVGAQSPLIEAVKAVDAAAVRSLLQKRADVNVAEPDGSTALYWAAEKNQVEIAQLLIGAGANASARTRYGGTPLAMASLNGNASFVDLLLKAGADPNTVTANGETVLMIAARTGVDAAVRALLSQGANPNSKEDHRGQSALMWAATEGHVEAVRALIEAGADVTARSRQGWTALLFAARDGRMEVVRALLDAGANANDSLDRSGGGRGGGAGRAGAPGEPARGASALSLAIGSLHYELAAHLLERGADPNAANEGWTVLHQITWVRKPSQVANAGPAGSGNMDSLELVKRLAAHGADVNARMTRRGQTGTTDLNMIGATPLLMAARTADVPLMRLLATLGADPMLVNEDRTTVLMAAAGVKIGVMYNSRLTRMLGCPVSRSRMTPPPMPVITPITTAMAGLKSNRSVFSVASTVKIAVAMASR